MKFNSNSNAAHGHANSNNMIFDPKTATFIPNITLAGGLVTTGGGLPGGPAFQPIVSVREVEVKSAPPSPSSRGSLFHLADRIFGKVLAIDKTSLEILLKHMDFSSLPVHADSGDDGEDDDDDPDYPIQNGIATIGIHGPLFKRENILTRYFGLTSYEGLKAKLDSAMSRDDVKGVLLDVDSPGGEAAGMIELSNYIHSLRGTKPIHAISNDSMYSAAYGIASAADKVFVTQDGGCGSVGCYMMHLDRSGLDEQLGLKFTYIFAGKKKVDGNPHEPLSSSAEETMQNEVNRVRDLFVSLVARNRNVTAQSVADTQAGIYFAQACTPMLADGVASIDECHAAMVAAYGDQDEGGEGEGQEGQQGQGQGGMFGTHSSVGLTIYSGPIPYHKTPTSTKPWDGPANEARLKNGQTTSYYRKFYAWQQSGSDGTKKNQYKFGHHDVSGGGDIGAANVQGCRAVIANLNGARTAPKIPSADRRGIYNHVARHIKDAGLVPAPLKSEAEYLEALALADLEFQRQTETLALTRLYSETPGIAAKFSDPACPAIPVVRRSASKATLSASSSRRISMLVVPYNSPSIDLGGFKEIYSPGCFALGLSGDPCALFNHDEAYVLGRQSAGTARFYETAEGVWCEADAPETQWADDLLTSMRRSDIAGSSAGFWLLKYHWETRNGERFRIIDRALMREAAVQTFPAYESSSASVVPQEQQQSQQSAVSPPPKSVLEARLRLLQLTR